MPRPAKLSRLVGAGALILVWAGTAAAAEPRPAVAVFDLEQRGGLALKPDVLDGMADTIVAALANSGRFTVVPRDEVRKALRTKQLESYKECYDESCQIELGKELAANKTLATKITRIGSICQITLTLFDLRTSTAEQASKHKGGCRAEQILQSVETATSQLVASPGFARNSGRSTTARRTAPSSPTPAGLTWIRSDIAGLDFTESEVTVAQYQACIDAGACKYASRRQTPSSGPACNLGDPSKARHPMNCASQIDGVEFCRWVGGRLPSDAEWRAEASAKGRRLYPWGRGIPSCARAALQGPGCGVHGTKPVCTHRGRSVSGLCDMVGNVSEWSSRFRLWGGSFETSPTSVTLMKGYGRLPALRHSATGFRCARPHSNQQSGSTRMVSFTSRPPGARVFLNDRAACETPCQARVRFGPNVVRMQKFGYAEGRRSVIVDQDTVAITLGLKAVSQPEDVRPGSTSD